MELSSILGEVERLSLALVDGRALLAMLTMSDTLLSTRARGVLDEAAAHAVRRVQ